MLVGNNIALVAFTFFMTKLMEPFLEPIVGTGMLSLLGYTLLITIVVLIFGEYLPKTLFHIYADRLIYGLAFPLRFFKNILSIPTYVMIGLSNLLLKYVMRIPPEKMDSAFTRLDLENYIDENLEDEHSVIDKELLTNVLQLNHQRVRDCMVPRNEIVALDITSDPKDALEIFIDKGLSRILVMDGDIENTLGYIHHQQLFSNPKSIQAMMMDIPFVPEAMNLKDLMFKFINENVNIGTVVDEYGSVSGIITLEDILEEIFGEIEDEHDEEEFTELKVWNDEYLFSGRLEVDYLNEKYSELSIPEGEYQTLSGYIVMTSGNIPSEGDEIILDNYKFVLERVSDTKIEVVRIFKLPEEKEDDNAD
jgi:CBS domain containing-hemolysin-like protein